MKLALLSGIVAGVIANHGSAAVVSGAQLLFDQPIHSVPGVHLFSSTVDNFGDTGYISADDFIIGSGGMIATVKWWGTLQGGGHYFTVSIFDDNGGQPGNLLASSSGVLSYEVFPQTAFPALVINEYDLVLNIPFLAQPATRYWLSVFDAEPNSWWSWSIGSPQENAAHTRRLDSPSWSPHTNPFSTNNLSFQLYTVPEPEAALLAATSLLLGKHRRRL